MYVSIFSDELGLDLQEAIPYFRQWGIKHVDLRGKIFGKELERLTKDEIKAVRIMLDNAGLKVACMESSIAKAHLPEDPELIQDQHAKLETLIMAADILDCKLVRCFHFWQGRYMGNGDGMDDTQLSRVLELTRPLIKRANENGLVMAFENCGASVRDIKRVIDGLGNDRAYLAWDPHNDWNEEAALYDSEVEYIDAQAKICRVVHVKAEMALPEAGPVLPWNLVYNILKANDYEGPLSVETHAHEVKSLFDQVGGTEVNRRVVSFTFDLLKG
jgi:sugar phosphate isomerase/epimerase